MTKLRDRILADPRVESLDDEGPGGGAFGDGHLDRHDYWCGLKRGFILGGGDYTHSIHEPTLTRILEELKRVEPCNRECCGGNGGPAI